MFGEAGALVSQAWLPAVEKARAAWNVVFFWCPRMGCFKHVFFQQKLGLNL